MKTKKQLSTIAVFLLGINSIIGSGIFLLGGKIYQDSGTKSLLAILFAGLSILVIAFSYANMSKLYPQNGGAFIYAKETFGRFAGFMIGVLTWLLGVVTISTEVSALLTAIKMLAPQLPSRAIGLVIILILGIVSYFGTSALSKLDNVTSFIKILIIVVFVVACIWLVKINHLTVSPSIARTGNGLSSFLAAYGTVFFFFTGFSFLPVNAEKMKNPSQTLPKVLVLVISTVIVVYLLVQAITIGVLGDQMPDSLVPAATAFSQVIGKIGVPFIIISICLSIFGVIVATTFNTPTILSSLAQAHEDVPERVAKVNKFGTPTLAVFLTTLAALLLFLSGSYTFLAGLTVFMSFVQYLSTGLANIKKRFFLVGIGTVLFSLVLLASFTPQTLILGLGIILFLILVYLLVKEKEKRPQR